MIEYRANFFMWFGFTIVYHATADRRALWVTLQQVSLDERLGLRQMAFLYGLWMLGHAFHNTFFFTVGEVPNMIREGRFDRFLVRPLDPLFQAVTVPQQIWPDELILAFFFFGFVTHFAACASTRLPRLRSARDGRRSADRLRNSARDRDARVLGHPDRHAALGRDVARARFHALPDQHLHSRGARSFSRSCCRLRS
jgi:hypothetical protein